MSHRIIIVDDHPLFRSALRQTLEGTDADTAFEEAGDIEGLTSALEANRDCDLVLLDLNMPGVRGFSGLLLLRAQFPEIPVMIVSAVEDVSIIRRCFDLGASGFLSKSESAARIRQSIDTILAGGLWVPEGVSLDGDDEQAEVLARLGTLTPQQIRVLMMLSDGLMNKQIAYELSISEATVKAHVSAILQKLGVDSRTQAVIASSKIEQGHFSQLFESAES
ncbi:response regulator [Pelagibacterium luteolum]|uniref:Two component transcriptional regulator, LuxR family n=1 Tax=Pelagibacterium luteolum TaxID=440168 RepID=A0A1G7Y468_9HYPH|nr:response regulator transcription factor [Pelagibacterium luteolum]SDG91245.1 two component transcriptional regulator, LuxR family [Pelagibacterium luteolum]